MLNSVPPRTRRMLAFARELSSYMMIVLNADFAATKSEQGLLVLLVQSVERGWATPKSRRLSGFGTLPVHT